MTNLTWVLIVIAALAVTYTLAYLARHSLYNLAMTFEAWLAGMSKHTLEINGRRISYLDNKKSTEQVILCLHGFSGTKEHFVRMAMKLKSFRVIAVDLAGHGETFKDIDFRHDLDDQVNLLSQFCSQLNLPPVTLIGNSMGGAITCVFASQHPERVRNAILFNPAGADEHQSELDQRIAAGKNTLIVENRADFKEVFRFTMSQPPYFPGIILSAAADIYAANQVLNHKIWYDFREAEHDYDFNQCLDAIQCPVLVCWGDQDRVLHPRNRENFLARIKHSSEKVFAGVGHLPMLEVPKHAAVAVVEFTAHHSS